MQFLIKKTIFVYKDFFLLLYYLNESLNLYKCILNKMIFYETDNRMKTIIKKFGGDVQFLTNYNLFTFGISFSYFFLFLL